MRCWAHHKDGWRCDLEASDHSEHKFTVTWPDEDCVNPAVLAPVLTPPSLDTPVRNPNTFAAAMESMTNLCFVCEHPVHGDIECPKQTRVPGGGLIACGCSRTVV